MGVGGGGRRCCVWGLVMGLLLVAAGGGTRGGVCWQGLGSAGDGGGLGVVRLWPGLWVGAGGDGVRAPLLVVGGAGGLLCRTGVLASRLVVWVLCVCAVRFLRSLAGCGVEVRTGGGCLGNLVGLWSVGSRWLLQDGACWHGVRAGGLLMLVGCSL